MIRKTCCGDRANCPSNSKRLRLVAHPPPNTLHSVYLHRVQCLYNWLVLCCRVWRLPVKHSLTTLTLWGWCHKSVKLCFPFGKLVNGQLEKWEYKAVTYRRAELISPEGCWIFSSLGILLSFLSRLLRFIGKLTVKAKNSGGLTGRR